MRPLRASAAVLLAAALLAGASAASAATYHRSFRNGYPAEASGREPGASAAVKARPRYERMLLALLPEEKVHAAAGFFGPVTKKYMPTFRRFSREYQNGAEKLKVIRKYLPDAERALAEAREMPVPEKYEREKAEYIQLFEAALATARFLTK